MKNSRLLTIFFIVFSGIENKEYIKMIRNQWYVVLESNEVGSAPLGVTRMGEKKWFSGAITPAKSARQ